MSQTNSNRVQVLRPASVWFEVPINSLRKLVACLAFGFLVSQGTASAAEIADFKHLGVATCASSTCHGKTTAQKDKTVLLNEYRTWVQEDLHAQAYRVLEA